MLRSVTVVVALALWGSACGGADTNSTDDTSTAYAAALSVDSAVEESGLVAAIGGVLTAQSTANGPAAANDGATITSLFTPAGCATQTTKLNVVTYTFDKCTGPYGLLRLDGTLTVQFTPSSTSTVQIQLAATGLKISTVSVDLMASAEIIVGVTQNSASVTSSSSATNARGDSATHSGSYTAGWDGTCLTLDGTFSTTIGTVSWATEIANFRQCSGMCPDAGGSVVVTGDQGGSVTVHYTDGGSAEVTGSAGTRGMIPLACGAV